MNSIDNRQDSCTSQSVWTAGPLIDTQEGKGFNRSGETMQVHTTNNYFFEVYPPDELAEQMQQPSPDIVNHLKQEGVEIGVSNKSRVSFLARVCLPCSPERSAVEVILTSTQRQNGGVYKHQTSIPRQMLRVHESAVETLLDSLNNAWHRHHWYPPY